MPRPPAKPKPVSAGLLMWRRAETAGARLEVLLAHPGGPFYTDRDQGVWTIPKGLVEPGEALEDAARREFGEEAGLLVPPEAPLLPLGDTVLKSRKTIHAWACEAPAELATAVTLPLPAPTLRNTYAREWPPRSGQWLRHPEIDRLEFFDVPPAREKIHEAQRVFLSRLEAALRAEGLL